MDGAAVIRELTIDELPKLSEIAREFMAATKFLDVDMGVFCKSWETFLSSGIGVVFVLDDFHGVLGAIKYQDPNNGEISSTEMFWFVLPEYRGKGISLVKEYERWAKENGCKKAIMVHLSDSMPDKLKILYKRMGYQEMETQYMKEL